MLKKRYVFHAGKTLHKQVLECFNIYIEFKRIKFLGGDLDDFQIKKDR